MQYRQQKTTDANAANTKNAQSKITLKLNDHISCKSSPFIQLGLAQFARLGSTRLSDLFSSSSSSSASYERCKSTDRISIETSGNLVGLMIMIIFVAQNLSLARRHFGRHSSWSLDRNPVLVLVCWAQSGLQFDDFARSCANRRSVAAAASHLTIIAQLIVGSGNWRSRLAAICEIVCAGSCILVFVLLLSSISLHFRPPLFP